MTGAVPPAVIVSIVVSGDVNLGAGRARIFAPTTRTTALHQVTSMLSDQFKTRQIRDKRENPTNTSASLPTLWPRELYHLQQRWTF